MAKKGLSIRERGEMGYWAHCCEFGCQLLNPTIWANYKAVIRGVMELWQIVVVLWIIATFPVSIPLIGWLRHRHAVKTLERELVYFGERKARMQSRVQKV